MSKTQYISRKGNFDSGHRVMNEFMKCFNIHGHTYLYELTFSFENMEEIGYAIDFKEIKRVFCQWIDDVLDHGMLLNPHDTKLIETTKDYGTKLWLMSLNGEGEYCNPSVENIAREVFLAMDIMTTTLYQNAPTGLKIHRVTIYETPNCWTEVKAASITERERNNFTKARWKEISDYANAKGVLEYDDRKITKHLKPGNLLTKKYSSRRDDEGAEDWANHFKNK
jgi:6-pyruvoyltetrahydropterin/6-carboxytetrahydropterin synthase